MMTRRSLTALLLLLVPWRARAWMMGGGAPGTKVINLRNANAWANGTFALGQRCTNTAKAYECINAGTSTSAPTGNGVSINNGGVAVFKYSSNVSYTNLSAWITANQGITLTRPTQINFWNDKPGTSWAGNYTLSSLYTSPTNDLTITAAPGESFADNPNRNGVPLNFNNQNGVAIESNYAGTILEVGVITSYSATNITISRLQIHNTVTSAHSDCIQHHYPGSSQVNAKVSQCILKAHGGRGVDFYSATAGGTITIINNLFISESTGNNPQNRGILLQNATAGTIVSNTFIVPTNYGPTTIGGTQSWAARAVTNCSTALTWRDNAFFGFASGISNQVNSSDDHNATDRPVMGTPFGTVTLASTLDQVSVPFTTATFRQPSDAGGILDTRIVANSSLAGTGSTVGAPIYDILGNPRTNGVDIGCQQVSG